MSYYSHWNDKRLHSDVTNLSGITSLLPEQMPMCLVTTGAHNIITLKNYLQICQSIFISLQTVFLPVYSRDIEE
jgi:hypothetical protein